MQLQNRWRAMGLAALVVAALMAWYGVRFAFSTGSILLTALYWLIFLLMLFVAFYCVILDLRFIRLQFKLGQRELFREAFDTEEFRRMMAEERKKGKQHESPPNPKDREGP